MHLNIVISINHNYKDTIQYKSFKPGRAYALVRFLCSCLLKLAAKNPLFLSSFWFRDISTIWEHSCSSKPCKIITTKFIHDKNLCVTWDLYLGSPVLCTVILTIRPLSHIYQLGNKPLSHSYGGLIPISGDDYVTNLIYENLRLHQRWWPWTLAIALQRSFHCRSALRRMPRLILDHSSLQAFHRPSIEHGLLLPRALFRRPKAQKSMGAASGDLTGMSL